MTGTPMRSSVHEAAPPRGGRGAALDRVVVVTKKTQLEELLERFVTVEQARFYLEHSGVAFEPYEAEHREYRSALDTVRSALPAGVRTAWIERGFLPAYVFGEGDLVVTLGPDGLVVNTAKYLDGQPILALNPAPARVDGVLLPFRAEQAGAMIRRALRGEYRAAGVTMARAEFADGQALHAVNDLFIGRRTHVSARYTLGYDGRAEDQSSSGIIVSTGAGSTEWLSSVLNGAAGVTEALCSPEAAAPMRGDHRFAWDAPELRFAVREPFASRTSGARIVWGRIRAGETLEITSRMPQDGVIFSDGVEEDYLAFDSGAVARIRVAERRAHLVVR